MFVLVLIGIPVLEVFAFVEVARAIGWLAALVVLLATSVLGARLVRVQSRAAVERVTLAVSERRPPGRPAIEGLLGFLGGALLVVPGFITDAVGALLLLGPTRTLASRWISRHYRGRVTRFVASSGRFAAAGRSGRPADVESTAIDDGFDRLGR